MKTSIVILTYNKLEYTQLCIKSIREFTNLDDYELILVDNNSTDGTVEWLKEQNNIKLILNKENMGFPKGCNQGIGISSGDNILLLNNDVVVTSRWLDNLVTCLYSSSDIGAVGAVTNNCSYYQTINTGYEKLEDMLQFAQEYNVSNPHMWEQRVKLVGFCMLIKREVIKTVGLLDERFSPGNYEDDDFSFRIIKSGYRLMLCKDTFVYHFGSTSFKSNPTAYNELLFNNQKKFESKWGFSPNYFCNIRREIVDLIDEQIETKLNVLEIGCACGATLLNIKSKYRNTNLYGIELNKNAAEICGSFARVISVDVEKIDMPYEQDFFDYIIFADVLEHLVNPEIVLKSFRKYLKNNGKILASIPNVSHYSVIWELLNGRWTYENAGILDRTHLRFFTLSEIHNLFTRCGYNIANTSSTVLQETAKSKELINKFSLLTGSDLKEEYNAYQYLIRAGNCTINELINNYYYNIINDIDLEKNISSMMKYNAQNIIKSLSIDKFEKANLLSFLAITCYENGITNNVIEYLKAAFELDNENCNIAYNLAYVLFQINEFRESLSFLEKIQFKNDAIIELISKNKLELIKEIYKNTNSMNENQNIDKLLRFVTLFPETENIHLIKDVGMIPYFMHKTFEYDSKVVCYKNGEYPYLNNEVKGLKIEFLENYADDSTLDGYAYLLKNSKNIDILHLFHIIPRTFQWIQIYKQLNPKGKIYLKLDANDSITKINFYDFFTPQHIEILKSCSLISVETKKLYEYLNHNWPIKVEYIPNGFFNVDNSKVTYSNKENIICTVGRIGYYYKANEILMEAFKNIHQILPEWKLRIIGPIQDSFTPFIDKYFIENPELKGKVIFTGMIENRSDLEEEYKRAKVFCLTSRVESFGIAMVEAESKGCYIITSNVTSATDLTDNEKYGSIFAIDDTKSLENILIKTCNDEDKLRKNSSKIQEYAIKNFSWENISYKIQECLNKNFVDSNIVKLIYEYANLNDNKNTVFIDRQIYNMEAFKMSFWQNHFELNSLDNYPEIQGDILDFGCGSGHLDILLGRKGRKIDGYDISPLGIALANYLKEKESLDTKSHLNFYCEDISESKNNLKKYDSVWSTQVFEHIDDPTIPFKGLRKKVKPGSYMLISVPLGYAYEDFDHKHHFNNEEELHKYLEKHIEVVRVDIDNDNKILRALCRF